MAPLVLGRAEHSEAGMPSVWIIPAFYPFKDGIGKLFARVPCPGVEEFQLHGMPERLHHRIIVTITYRSH
jgi:hypothetical protein